MDIDGSPFRAFLAVARHQSFTRAAQELNISQPALSATIRELERRLGFSLFDRTSRRVTLTREGRSYQVNARRVVLEHEWASQRARELRNNDLRLAVQPYSSLITARVALTDGYMERFPETQVQITQISSGRIYDAIIKNDADIGIVLEPEHRLELSPINPATGPELEAFAVDARKLGLFIPCNHPLAHYQEIPEAELKDQQIAVIGRVHGGPLASAIGRYLEEQGANPVRVPEADFFSTIRYARRNNIAAIDTGWFDLPEKSSGFLRLPVSGQPLATEMVLLRSTRAGRPSADHFWRSVVAAASDDAPPPAP